MQQAGCVYVTRVIPEAGLSILRARCQNVEINHEDKVLPRPALLEKVAKHDGILCTLLDPIDEKVLDAAAPRCRVFSNYAVGFNNIDVAAATRRGILVTNTPGVLTETTADLIWALLLATARRIVEADRFFRTGGWDGWSPMQFLGRDVHGATLGIVGAGRIGTEVALRSVGFKMHLLYTSSRENSQINRIGGRRVDLPELLSESDFVTLHVPYNKQTHHLIGQDQLAKMKPSAYLINTSRGPVVDEIALVQSLRGHRIAGAGLDVYEEEPIPAPGLTELDNVVCIPHLGSATLATREKMAVMAAENLVAALTGERPPNPVNPEVLNFRK